MTSLLGVANHATPTTARLISVTVPVEGVTLTAFMAHGSGQPRFYWDNTREEVGFAGIGAAADLEAWGADRFEIIHEKAQRLFVNALIDTPHALATPRLFGGFAFRDDFVPDNTWADFAPAQFILPHYQLLRVAEKYYLTINAQIPHHEDAAPLLGDLRDALHAKIRLLQEQPLPQPASQHPLEVNYPMTRTHWETIITRATARIQQGDLNKVVLARVAEIRFDERIHLESALAYLAQTYPQTWRFVFEPRPHVAFYGATPEILVQVDGTQLTTMALAGSIRRGTSAEEDTQLAEKLLNDPKERFEHQIVVDRIEERLAHIAHHSTIGVTGVLQLSNIQHLYTPIEARLAHGEGVLPILARLHPTPALGGDPRDIALEVINDSETVPRGWYGAPIGWLDYRLNGQFGVAIRSAVAQEKRVWLYAGCGVVAESQPQREWDETTLKFRPMLNALGVKGDILHES